MRCVEEEKRSLEDRLKETSSKLEETSSRLEETSTKLEETSTKLEEVSTDLKITRDLKHQLQDQIKENQKDRYTRHRGVSDVTDYCGRQRKTN